MNELKSAYHQLCDIGEQTDKIADVLLRERDHNLHRIGVVCRDMSLTIVQALTSLSVETRKHIAELEQAA
jgi:hypothetical protein